MPKPPSSLPTPSKAAALSHVPCREELPRVIAVGSGELARRIVALALEHGVKVREDADLAEVMASLEIDAPIPVEVLGTVAEILAYVYRANRQPSPEVHA